MGRVIPLTVQNAEIKTATVELLGACLWVRSLDRMLNHGAAGRLLWRGRVLRAGRDKDGYEQVALGRG